ncbi:MAG TPA: site-specific DNA-methyltransferase [Firmicutes bacterium]|nr:site-specific DNA-methyltransferase [Bacillota bacterium]
MEETMREDLYRKSHWSNRNKTLAMEPGDENIYIPKPLPEKELTPGIYWGEALQALKRIEDQSIQAVFADPPYFGKQKAFGRTVPNVWEEYSIWTLEWLKEAYRVTKDTGSLYVCCDWSYSGKIQDLIEKAGFITINRITWKRDKGRGALKNWKNNMEDIWFAVKDEEKYHFDVTKVKVKKKVIAPYRDDKGRPKDWLEEDGQKYRLVFLYHPCKEQ